MMRPLALSLALALALAALAAAPALAAKPPPASSPAPASAGPGAPPPSPVLAFSPCNDPTFEIGNGTNNGGGGGGNNGGGDEVRDPSGGDNNTGGGSGGGGGCSDADPANADACAPSSVPFKCGNTPKIETLACTSGSMACRLIPGVTTCDGDVVAVKEEGAAGVRVEARGVLSSGVPVLIKGGDGYCTFPDPTGLPLRPPVNCGGKNQSGLSYADVCYCSGKNGALGLVDPGTGAAVASLADRAALPCEPVELESMTAVDSCARKVLLLPERALQVRRAARRGPCVPGRLGPLPRVRRPRRPQLGTITCDGDAMTVSVGADGALAMKLGGPGVMAGGVRTTSNNKKGYCPYADSFSQHLHAPTNCGSGDKQCGLGYVDFCCCSGKSGAARLSVASLADRDALPCEALELEPVSAANGCGQALDIAVTIVSPDGNIVTTLPAGATSVPANGFPACGDNHVYATAINPRNQLSSQVGFTVDVRDEVVPQPPAPTSGASICTKTFETKCGGGARPVAPLGFSMAGCALAARFPDQADACGATYPVGDETLAIGGCGGGTRRK